MKDARENLKWWGMTEAGIGMLEREKKVTTEIRLTAPTDGVVTEVLVQPGDLINAGDKSMKSFVVTGKSVARIVSTRHPYRIEGYVFPDQLPLLQPGTPVKLRLPNGKSIERTVSQVLPQIDAATQRAAFRVELGRLEPSLVPGTVIRVSLQIRHATGTWVPRDAVLTQYLEPTVYVKLAPNVFERRRVTVLAATDSDLQVTGVQPPEKVVTIGKTMLEGAFRMAGSGRPGGDHDH